MVDSASTRHATSTSSACCLTQTRSMVVPDFIPGFALYVTIPLGETVKCWTTRDVVADLHTDRYHKFWTPHTRLCQGGTRKKEKKME